MRRARTPTQVPALCCSAAKKPPSPNPPSLWQLPPPPPQQLPPWQTPPPQGPPQPPGLDRIRDLAVIVPTLTPAVRWNGVIPCRTPTQGATLLCSPPAHHVFIARACVRAGERGLRQLHAVPAAARGHAHPAGPEPEPGARQGLEVHRALPGARTRPSVAATRLLCRPVAARAPLPHGGPQPLGRARRVPGSARATASNAFRARTRVARRSPPSRTTRRLPTASTSS